MFFNGNKLRMLIIDELNRKGFTTGTGNSRENKVDCASIKKLL